MVSLLVVLESGLGGNSPEQLPFIRGRGTKELLGGLLPSDGGLPVVLLGVLEEAHVDKDLDELREAGVSQSTSARR